MPARRVQQFDSVEVIMRLSVEPVFGSVLVAAIVAAGAMGCADNESSLFVRQVQAAAPPECRVTADPGAEFLPYGVLDVALNGGGYQATVLVGNQLVKRGSGDKIRTETARVSLRGAIVRINDSMGASIMEFTVDGTGFVDPGSESEPGYGLLSTTLVPPGTPGINDWVTVWIKVFGQTLGGKEIESNELSYPIYICSGCLISYPPTARDPSSLSDDYRCMTGGTVTDVPCIIGQDGEVPCNYCVGTVDECAGPGAG